MKIEFRGQKIDTKEWVYGVPAYGFNQSVQYIMPKMYFATRDFGEPDDKGNPILDDCVAIGGYYPIIPESVGQFTGLFDKNGNKIFRGDYCKIDRQPEIHEIVERNGAWSIKTEVENGIIYQAFFNGIDLKHVEVVGNIYENK